jgi:hydrogenase-4 component B
MAEAVAAGSWLLVPVAIERASYGPAIFLLGVAASFALAFLLVRTAVPRPSAARGALGLRLPWQNARMQDTAEGFGQPIRQIFEPFFRMERELPTRSTRRRAIASSVGDHFWHWLYLPLAALVERLARLIGLLQQGRIAVYLLYSFVTLMIVLAVVKQ